MFEIGNEFTSTCIFTGGSHMYTVVSREESILHCEATYYEMDGIHKVKEDFEIHTDASGREYIILWEYKDHKGIHYAE